MSLTPSLWAVTRGVAFTTPTWFLILSGLGYSLKSPTTSSVIAAFFAGSITFAGIKQTLFLSRERSSFYLKRFLLKYWIMVLGYRKDSLGQQLLDRQDITQRFKRAEQTWTRELGRMPFMVPLADFVPASLFGLSATFAVATVNVEIVSALFLFGVSLLVWNVMEHLRNLRIFNVLGVKLGNGKLTFVQIGGKAPMNARRAIVSIDEKLSEMKIKVNFTGHLSNGFVDSRGYFIRKTSGEHIPPVWHADESSYLADTRYAVGPLEDAGILQGDLNEDFDLLVPLKLEGFRGRDDPEAVIQKVEIWVFEDPIPLPITRLRGSRSPSKPQEARMQIDRVVIEFARGSQGGEIVDNGLLST